MRAIRRALSVAGAILLVPFIASAHAFGTQYALPLPANFYILGGVVAFIASSVVLLLFSDPIPAQKPGKGMRTGKMPAFLPRTLQFLGIFLLFLEVLFAFFGSPSFEYNPAVVLFWILFLLVFTYVSALIGGIWEYANPFKTLARWVLGGDRGLYRYPDGLGYWPAIAFLLILVMIELFSNAAGSLPQTIGVMLSLYAVLQIGGAALFGISTWFRYGDLFSVFFGVVSSFAPLQLTEKGVEGRFPGQRLTQEAAPHLSLVLFILLMLSSTAVDGLKETKPWSNAFLFINSRIPLDFNTIGIIALILSPFVFFGLYALAIYAVKLLARSGRSYRELLLAFGYSLIPIAIAYHFAHYFSLAFGDGQRIIAQASDPFTRGWNLFGTAHYIYNPVPLSATAIWYIQLGVIVGGHIIAAVIAHRVALRLFPTRRSIQLSQLPLLVLMVGYTALGLWILSRPFVPGV